MSFGVHSEKANILFHRLITPASQRLISRNWGCVSEWKVDFHQPLPTWPKLEGNIVPSAKNSCSGWLLKFKETGLSSSQQFPASTAGFLHLSQKTPARGCRCFPDRLLTSLLMHQRMPIKNFITAVWDSSQAEKQARCHPDAWIFLLVVMARTVEVIVQNIWRKPDCFLCLDFWTLTLLFILWANLSLRHAGS